MKIFLSFLTPQTGFFTFCTLTFTLFFSGSGSTWKVLHKSESLHTVAFSNVLFFDNENGIAAALGEIKKTVDGGIAWENSFEDADTSFSSFASKDNVVWVVGAKKENPAVFYSKDRGTNWKQINFEQEQISKKVEKHFSTFFDICFDKNNRVWLAGDGGIVEALTNNGETFQVSDVFLTKETLFSISCGGDGEVWSVGENGTVFHYQNNWARTEIKNSPLLTKVKVIDNDIWILGGLHSGILLKSQDNGKTWEDKAPELARSLYDLYFDGRKGWLTGAEGSIYFSDDNGNSWIKTESSTSVDLVNIFSLNTNNLWISGDKATVLKYQN